ncbi:MULTISPECIES: aldose epimerase [unclassified Caballeronia]|uniref:aldose epimerase family protein n=1 Tax=unclassified Caballeronia TaxID=2646786 RepID=UPI00285896AE|nr:MULTISPECIES: aldose epimerase [unclassified Caballeronia]MDR5751095.1 aldose epimerase [Caballeronia sp. LZ024]MDR5844768.1 aldose epimerase [Caballeronia sp. LZ031]
MSSEQDIIDITRDGASISLAPQAGGRLMTWRVGGEPVIHWPATPDWSQPAKIRGGNPLLFPFLGRHFVTGEIGKWRDPDGVIHDLPTHGFARSLPFSTTKDADGHGLRMTLVDSDATRAGYPFAFRFEAAYRLVDANTLDVELTTSNPGEVALPYYAGHHFYFHLPHDQRASSSVELPRTEQRHQLPDGSISEAVPGAPRYTLDDPSIVDRFHCFTGPSDQPVRLFMPSLKRMVSFELDQPDSVPWYAVTTWTEADTSDFYCVEPWIGLPDAIHNGRGLRWLAPGKTESASLRLVVSPLD